MSSSESNAHRFLSAFANIEDTLARQQRKRENGKEWVSFSDLLAGSDTLLEKQKHQLRTFAKLRNAISHSPYIGGEAIADPRTETVEAIEKIYRDLERPPLLIDALRHHERPILFELDADVMSFLKLVIDHDFSQIPVKTVSGYALLTTNAVARWFATNFTQYGGVVETTPLREIMAFAETGDRLKIVNPGTTTVQAINLLSGQAQVDVEPPAALLVQGKMGQPPQRLCVRADLSLLYTQLGG
ncbi:hypothetical protein [Flaviflexus equikiangi]|uniref:CBS domain-containing protein n=1 Tax=Flaviflexus equikiangi TaxID=2758573 RepID=A0ABS2TCX2_9ACTO|nr:hypothetical protein [Flaviflexus equikiangi]MBM9432500.1 hypothetical protein [Flaviflexus equikiangi]